MVLYILKRMKNDRKIIQVIINEDDLTGSHINEI